MIYLIVDAVKPKEILAYFKLMDLKASNDGRPEDFIVNLVPMIAVIIYLFRTDDEKMRQ